MHDNVSRLSATVFNALHITLSGQLLIKNLNVRLFHHFLLLLLFLLLNLLFWRNIVILAENTINDAFKSSALFGGQALRVLFF